MNEVGINREKWLPNPAIGELGLTTSVHAEMLEFLGRLMGVAVRSQEPLDLDLPSIVWKQLVRSPITRYLAVCIFAPLQRIVSWLVRVRGVACLTGTEGSVVVGRPGKPRGAAVVAGREPGSSNNEISSLPR